MDQGGPSDGGGNVGAHHDAAYANGGFGAVPASGDAIASLPRMTIGESQVVTEEGECVVCLERYELGDVVRTMPCSHHFHDACIVTWLRVSRACPLCRFRLPAEQVDFAWPPAVIPEHLLRLLIRFVTDRVHETTPDAAPAAQHEPPTTQLPHYIINRLFPPVRNQVHVRAPDAIRAVWDEHERNRVQETIPDPVPTAGHEPPTTERPPDVLVRLFPPEGNPVHETTPDPAPRRDAVP